jgi:hypothetical protein
MFKGFRLSVAALALVVALGLACSGADTPAVTDGGDETPDGGDGTPDGGAEPADGGDDPTDGGEPIDECGSGVPPVECEILVSDLNRVYKVNVRTAEATRFLRRLFIDRDPPVTENMLAGDLAVIPPTAITPMRVYAANKAKLYIQDPSADTLNEVGGFAPALTMPASYVGLGLDILEGEEEIDVGGQIMRFPVFKAYAVAHESLYEVNLQNAATTLVGKLQVQGEGSPRQTATGDLAIDLAGTAYVSLVNPSGSGPDVLARVSLTDGATTVVGEIEDDQGNRFEGVSGLAFLGGKLYAVDTAGQLLLLDTATGAARYLGRIKEGASFLQQVSGAASWSR